MSASKRKRSNRSSSSRHRTVRHVAPVLDPNWQNPYTPSVAERETNQRAIRTSSMRRLRPALYGASGVFILSVVVTVAGFWVKALHGIWWPVVGLAFLGAVLGSNELSNRRLESRVPSLAAQLAGEFAAGGSSTDALRLSTIVDRLSATFGLNDVNCRIVRDEAYNATLLPNTSGFSLLVTEGLMNDFELIEIEGVVAHLMARQRLSLLERQCAAALSRLDFGNAHELSGDAVAYRADEVAAAAIRYPHGLCEALIKCGSQNIGRDSFFASERYGATRWVWFNQFADRPSSLPGDLDDPRVRSRALAEW